MDSVQGMTQTSAMRQEQTLTPQQLQSLDILCAPVLELQQKINQELAVNPVLEVEEPAAVELPEPPPDQEKPELGSERDDMEDELARIVELTPADSPPKRRHFPPVTTRRTKRNGRRIFSIPSRAMFPCRNSFSISSASPTPTLKRPVSPKP